MRFATSTTWLNRAPIATRPMSAKAAFVTKTGIHVPLCSKDPQTYEQGFAGVVGIIAGLVSDQAAVSNVIAEHWTARIAYIRTIRSWYGLSKELKERARPRAMPMRSRQPSVYLWAAHAWRVRNDFPGRTIRCQCRAALYATVSASRWRWRW